MRGTTHSLIVFVIVAKLMVSSAGSSRAVAQGCFGPADQPNQIGEIGHPVNLNFFKPWLCLVETKIHRSHAQNWRLKRYAVILWSGHPPIVPSLLLKSGEADYARLPTCSKYRSMAFSWLPASTHTPFNLPCVSFLLCNKVAFRIRILMIIKTKKITNDHSLLKNLC